jgi:hypothetical protein
MNANQAIDVVKSLANGIDPTTGEVFALDSPYNQPIIIRSLYQCLQAMQSPTKKVKRTADEKQADNLAKGLPRNANMPWSDGSREALAAKFNAGSTPNELTVQFERTVGSILAQLKSQGLITEEQARHY